jgi:hypothetical protein
MEGPLPKQLPKVSAKQRTSLCFGFCLCTLDETSCGVVWLLAELLPQLPSLPGAASANLYLVVYINY